jgi:hypothetical protein
VLLHVVPCIVWHMQKNATLCNKLITMQTRRERAKFLKYKNFYSFILLCVDVYEASHPLSRLLSVSFLIPFPLTRRHSINDFIKSVTRFYGILK